jgi:hypothetical protein
MADLEKTLHVTISGLHLERRTKQHFQLIAEHHNLAVHSAGRVTVWGENTNGTTRVLSGLTTVVAVAAGFNHSLAIVRD